MNDEPMNLPLAGVGGVHLPLTPKQQKEARQRMTTVLCGGLSDEEIREHFEDKFNLAPDMVQVLKDQVLRRLKSESDERKPFNKSMAEVRILRHIAQAAKRNAWSAVANFESQLAKIQGTEEATETNLNLNVQMQAGVLQVLEESSQEEVAELIAEGIAIIDSDDRKRKLLPR